EWNNCGPATLAMTLSYFGIRTNQKETAAILKPNPEDRNVSPAEMVAYVNNQTDLQALTRVNGDTYTIRRLVASGFPVILEIGIDPPGEFRWMGWYGHYMLVVAYDDAQQQFWTYDSWLGTSDEPLTNADADGRDLPYTDVATYWPHFNRNYIVLYEPERAAEVAEIVGENMDDATMWQNALKTWRAETAAAPDNAFNWFNLGTTYNALGQYAEAAAAFDQARAIGLPWRMLWYQFGPYEAYYQTGRYDDVILLANVTLENRPYFEESFYYKGLAEEAQGNLNEARQDLQQAADFNPNFAPAAAALANIQDGGS
ncbi:MAG: C39 family peptidase, partial [Anaerolineales bacterium]|nr:C39 family peptidase [Anaerolineales bacterium]